MNSTLHMVRKARTPKYQAVLPPMIADTIMATPDTGVAHHFIKRAARIAFLIRAYSFGSGRMGRIA